MVQFHMVAAWLAAGYARLSNHRHPDGDDRADDRGDVPGWVMVTVITTDRIRRWRLKARK